MTRYTTDILVVGAGISGCVAAIALSEAYHVTLIDKLATPIERIGDSLAPSSNRILRELKIYDGMHNPACPMFLNNAGIRSFWGNAYPEVVDHLRNPDGPVKNLDRRSFEAYLRKCAEERGVNCLWGVSLYSTSFENTSWTIQLKPKLDALDTSHISASFVIDASGRQSHFARKLGVERSIEDCLIACWFSLANDQENSMSTISAQENGWWYSAIVPKNKRIVAFHTDPDLITRNELKTSKSVIKLAEGNEAIYSLLRGKEDQIEMKGTRPANSTRLQQVAGERWAAIGDAAINFDPLSSQGMFNAMASAMQLKDLISQYHFTQEVSEHYRRQTEQIWSHYLQHKRNFYRMEKRWSSSEFWKRRHHVQQEIAAVL